MKQFVKYYLFAVFVVVLVVMLFNPRPARSRYTGIRSVAFSPDSAWLAVDRRDALLLSTTKSTDYKDVSRTVSVFNLQSQTGGQVLEQARLSNRLAFGPRYTLVMRPGQSVGFVDDAPTLAVIQFGPEGANQLYDVQTLQGRPLIRTDDPSLEDFTVNMAISGDGKTIATGNRDGVVLWDADDGSQKGRLSTGTVSYLDSPRFVFSRGGESIIAVGYEGIQVWDLSSGIATKLVFEGISEDRIPGIVALALSPTNDLIALGIGDRLLLYDLNGRIVSEMPTFNRIFGACFSPDGKELAASYGVNGTKFFDVSAGVESQEPLHGNPMSFVVRYSPDGAYLATAGYGETISLWDATTRILIRTLKAPGP